MEHSALNGHQASITPRSREITQVSVRAPTVRDLMALEPVKGTAQRTAKMIELLTGLSVREVSDLHADDFKGLGEMVTVLFRRLEEVRSILGMLMSRYHWSPLDVERLTTDDILEYEAAFREAEVVAALPPEDPIAPGRFPFLDADIGVTDLPGAGRKVETVREAAATALGARDLWHAAGASIRARRLTAKAAITAAATDAEAFRAYHDAWTAAP